MKLNNVAFNLITKGMSRKQSKVIIEDVLTKLNSGDFSDTILPSIGEFNLSNNTSPFGLFDYTTWDVQEWNTPNVAYWSVQIHFIELTFNQSVLVFSRSGAWLDSQMNPLNLYQVVGQDLIFLEQTTAGLVDEFNLLCEVPAGTYRFYGIGTARIDSAWAIIPK